MAKKTIRNIPQDRAPIPAQEPAVRAHNFDEVSLGFRLEDALVESERCLVCPNPQCVPACPVNIDIPGFIVNRVQAPSGALLGAIVDHGIAAPEELDALFRKLGKPMGPFELNDFTGLDISYDARNYFAKAISADLAPFKLMELKVAAGEYGKKTGRGFYDWSKGRPEINLNKATEKVDPKDILAVQINEATKLIEWGVATAEDIDKAIINGTGNKKGPMEDAQQFEPENLVSRLERLSRGFNKKIFEPTGMIREGKYLNDQN